MLFVCFADTNGDIANDTIKWKKGRITAKSLEKVKIAIAKKLGGDNQPHHIKLINWKRLRET